MFMAPEIVTLAYYLSAYVPMKKIDKLVIGSFLGPFLITFLVVVFILLNIQMIKYFDDIIGKGLDWSVLAQLFFYFGVITTPTALPLAVLLSSLITYGNLGEHFELTAIKAAGISLLRTIQPIFIFIIFLTVIAFFANNNMVPKAALEAYSLLYDIKQKKPALDLREGTFYNGIPDISIKVSEKFPDGETIKDVIIYDHRKNDGNKEVIKADSGRMYTILNERYLKLELFDGYNYSEGATNESEVIGKRKKGRKETLSRSKFEKSQVVFDLSSFQLERTEKKWFQSNRIMRNLAELDVDLDSINNEILNQRLAYFLNRPALFSYYEETDSLVLPVEIKRFKERRDSLSRAKYVAEKVKQDSVTPPAELKTVTDVTKSRAKNLISATRDRPLPKVPAASKPKKIVKEQPESVVKDSIDWEEQMAANQRAIDSVFAMQADESMLSSAANIVRSAKSQMNNNNVTVDNYDKEYIIFRIQWHKIIASSMACIAMFLIGAPLGAIIKKGGLGVPFLVSVLFFIVYYVLSIQGEKFAKQEAISVVWGIWLPDIILLFIGLIFLRQARVDARLFDMDSYLVAIDRLKTRMSGKRVQPAKTA